MERRWKLAVMVSAVAACVHCRGTHSEAPPRASRTRAGLQPIPDTAMRALLEEEDCDGDDRITILDRELVEAHSNACAADGTFRLRTATHPDVDVVGTHHLSNLLAELVLAQRHGRGHIRLEHVFEDPVTRISRSIRERFWDGLTRRMDPEHLDQVLADTKVASDVRYLYVPADDERALSAFSSWVTAHPTLGIQVRALPADPTPQWVRALDGRHGLLALAMAERDGVLRGVPYVVPGGRFNELYGWDSYFHVLGLVADGRGDLARSVVDNLVYEVEHYGKVLNANRSYYLTRSQPPFLASMIREVRDAASLDGDDAWSRRAVSAAMREYATVWLGQERTTSLCDAGWSSDAPWDRVCLSRYFGSGEGEPPEVEPGHFRWVYEKRARALGVSADALRQEYLSGVRTVPELDDFFRHDRCMRESGHDTTFRWFDPDVGEGRCADFATVDLNVLLHRFEVDMAQTLAESVAVPPSVLASVGLPVAAASTEFWCQRARSRARLVKRYLYDAEGALFYDYDFVHGRRSEYVSATTLYALASPGTACSAPLVDRGQARRLLDAALEHLEAPGGIAATAKASVTPFGALPPRQWEYPNGWAPHQIIAWQGLAAWGFHAELHRLAYAWLWMIARNAADYAGTVPEKFDVVARSHRVFAEYGNVGTEFRYITDEGFGWMNASFQLGLALLDEPERERLRRLEPWCTPGAACR